ncbi:MAG TPA: hypothetical protein VEH07_05525 [Alphaproteobacteria bacterium]|nr:hypothetical protein [Alphaproteobacteria bacterium]
MPGNIQANVALPSAGTVLFNFLREMARTPTNHTITPEMFDFSLGLLFTILGVVAGRRLITGAHQGYMEFLWAFFALILFGYVIPDFAPVANQQMHAMVQWASIGLCDAISAVALVHTLIEDARPESALKAQA